MKISSLRALIRVIIYKAKGEITGVVISLAALYAMQLADNSALPRNKSHIIHSQQ